jgi:hypothetical protein
VSARAILVWWWLAYLGVAYLTFVPLAFAPWLTWGIFGFELIFLLVMFLATMARGPK